MADENTQPDANQGGDEPEETKPPVDFGDEDGTQEDTDDGAPDPVSDISHRLSNQAGGEDTEDTEVAIPQNPVPFDITALTPDQIQTLKAMLASTPERSKRANRKPTIKVRRINDKFVVDFKTAYKGLVRDLELQRDVERHFIPVLLEGEKEFKPVLYKDFIHSEQVVCEVIGTRQEEDEIIEGETISRETLMPVDMVIRVVHEWFTIKLPDGRSLEIESKIANA